jgi:hypothetical protein
MNEERYYMPAEIAVGLFDDKGSRAGFVSYGYKDKGWQRQSIFKRLTGYSPSQQKDAETQFKKIVENAVRYVPNDPVEGFRVTGDIYNIYRYKTSDGNRSSDDVVLSDPRGFRFGISPASFAKLVSAADVSNGALVGKYAYARQAGSPAVVLLREGTPEFEEAVAARVEFENREKTVLPCVKKNELSVGAAYSAAKVLTGNWVYAGVRDTYSDKCHLDAFDRGCYDVEAAVEDEKDWSSSGYCVRFKTSIGRMVFFPAEYRAECPWTARASIHGVFSARAPAPGSFVFAGAGARPPTVDSIEDAVAESPAFQRIDFSRFAAENAWERLSEGVFRSMLSRKDCTRPELSAFPFGWMYYRLMKSAAYGSHWLKITDLTCGASAVRKFRVVDLDKPAPAYSAYSAWSFAESRDVVQATLSELYSEIEPVVPVLYFENGRRVSQSVAAMFVPAETRRAAESR